MIKHKTAVALQFGWHEIWAIYNPSPSSPSSASNDFIPNTATVQTDNEQVFLLIVWHVSQPNNHHKQLYYQ